MPNFKLITSDGTYNVVVSVISKNEIQWFATHDGGNDEMEGTFEMNSGNAFIKAAERVMVKLEVSGVAINGIIVPEGLLQRFLEKYASNDVFMFLDNKLNESL